MNISQTLYLENHEKMASAIFVALTEKVFTIVTSQSVIPGEFVNITELLNCRLAGTLIIENGKISIPLLPNRKIFWDVLSEKVSVCFKDNGVIQISRVLPGNRRVLYRTIIPVLNPT